MSFLDKLKSFFSSSDSSTVSSTKSASKSASPSEKGNLTGTVRYFNRSRGYGFIHKEDSKEKVFVHISDLKQRIKVGDHVRFSIEKTEKGDRARNVTKTQ